MQNDQADKVLSILQKQIAVGTESNSHEDQEQQHGQPAKRPVQFACRCRKLSTYQHAAQQWQHQHQQYQLHDFRWRNRNIGQYRAGLCIQAGIEREIHGCHYQRSQR